MSRWIAGIFDPAGFAPERRLPAGLRSVDASVFHSGPMYVAASGPTPGTSPVCLLDGFLDNGAALAEQLGCSPDLTDEALLSVAWRRWGRGLPERMRGDFVLLIWDHEIGEGLIARDQIGVRPFFVHHRGASVYFACDLRHLLELLPSRPGPDTASVAHWLAASSRPGTATLYEGVQRLAAGAMLCLDRTSLRETRYWRPRYREPQRRSSQELAEETRVATATAVDRRLAPRGLTGLLMSGGLDSAAIATLAPRESRHCLRTYSAVFPDHPGVDETARIESLRQATGIEGSVFEVRAGGLLRAVLDLTSRWQVPVLGWGDAWTMPLMRDAAAAGVAVMLGGDGGDEVFGTRSYLLADETLESRPWRAVGLALQMPGAAAGPSRREVGAMLLEVGGIGALPFAVHERIRRRVTPGWLRPGAASALSDSDDPLEWKRLDGPRWWAHAAHGIANRLDEIGIFEHQRRRAAAAGLEARHPLLDLDLVELALRQPPEASFDPERNRPVLRAALDGHAPELVRSNPHKAWFDSLLLDGLLGADVAFVRALLTGSSETSRYVCSEKLVPDLLDRQRLSFDDLLRLWRLVTMEIWLRLQAGAELPTEAAETSRPCVRLLDRPAGSAVAA